MDNEVQADEITALESIYSEQEFSYQRDEDGCYRCTFHITVALPKTYQLAYKDVREQQEEPQKIQISHLPPLVLEVTLPKDYPCNSPPNFQLKGSWLSLPALSKLCEKLDELWEQNGDQILFLWVDFLKQETLAFLNIGECLEADHFLSKEKEKERDQDGEGSENSMDKPNDSRAVRDQSIEESGNPVQFLINYNKERERIEFMKNFYYCKICFSEALGEQCVLFSPCNHIFCQSCIINYVEVRIRSGNIRDIRCPEEKCTSELSPSQIKGLISSDLYSKYESMLLNIALDTMPDIVYCPRRTCNYPASVGENEPASLAQCPNCQFAFCIYCKAAYHAVEPCKILSAGMQDLLKEYQDGTPEVRLQLQQRYGRKNLDNLVEARMSESWISENTNTCPFCNAAIEKSGGCNVMTCGKCRTHFCWLCHEILNSHNPHDHYGNPQSKCFRMMLHGMVVDGGEHDEEEEEDDEEEEEDDVDPQEVYMQILRFPQLFFNL